MSSTTRHFLVAFAATLLLTPPAALHAADAPRPSTVPLAVEGRASGAAMLSTGFENPPPSARPWVFWFWMGGNITKEGITADLEAMARIGIHGALIMNVQQGITAPKPAVFMSPQWRALFRHGAAEANRLGMEICMHNCDGWMGSGGPWITPAQAMQELTWSETKVRGPGKFSGTLPQPKSLLEHYRDVAVLAVPALAGERSADAAEAPKLSSSSDSKTARRRAKKAPSTDTKPKTSEGGDSAWLQLEYARPVVARALTVYPDAVKSGLQTGELRVSDDGKEFRKVCEFQLAWRQDSVNGSLTVAFPPVEARVFRVAWAAKPDAKDMRLSKMRILTAPRVNYWEAKAGFCHYNEHGGGAPLYRCTSGGTLKTVGQQDRPLEIPPEAIIRRGDVLDLSAKMTAGKLDWEAPPGEWIVLRIGHTANGRTNAPATDEGRGPACDKMSASAMDAHFAGMVAKLLDDVGPLAGKSFTGVEIDSWECGQQNWTPGFRDEFRKRRGYDLLPLLPVMAGGRIVESLEVSERFLWDVRRTIADLIGANYYGRSRELCRSHGLTFFAEASGRQQYLYDPLVYQREGDLPMGEFWVGNPPRVDCKVAASAAHTYGKTIVGAESYTTAPEHARWTNDPFNLKQLGDEAFCIGVNRFVFHRYAHQPWLDVVPGMTMGPWGIHLERTLTWWEPGRAWMQYLARCQHLLQQGHFVADVCYFPGDDVPNYLGLRNELTPPLPAGYDYDGVDARTIVDRMSVDEQGRIALGNGMCYRTLLLPAATTIQPAVLRKVQSLVKSGATVIGPKPSASPSLRDFPHCDSEVKAIAEELWGPCDGVQVKERACGKGRVIWGRPFDEILAAGGVPADFAYQAAGAAARLMYIHRRLGDADIYFVANAEPAAVEASCTFRVDQKRPELWHPDSGQREYPAVYEPVGGSMRLPMRLEPYGSVFVVFRSPLPPSYIVAVDRVASGSQPAEPPLKGSPVLDNNRHLSGRFTMSFWAHPAVDIALPAEAASGMVRGKQDFAITPAPGHEVFGENHAGAGVSVGRNGICVIEHGARHLAPVLVHPVSLSDWVHVAIVYRDGQPSLYLDGKLVHSGRKSSQIVHPSLGVKSDRKSRSYSGKMATEMQFDRVLGTDEIAALARAGRPGSANRLPRFVAGDDGRIRAQFEQPGRFDLRFSAGGRTRVEVASLPPALELGGAWVVRFPPGRGAPETAVFDRLASWTTRPEPGIKYFSGTATYEKQWELPANLPGPSRRLLLDLGEVKNLAEVKLNGQDLGILWKPPFCVDATNALKPGTNRLEVRVTNLWPNRLIGDEQLPDDCQWGPPSGRGGNMLKEWPRWLVEGKPRTSGRLTFSTWKHWFKDSELLPSGLLGPVQVRCVEEVTVPSP